MFGVILFLVIIYFIFLENDLFFSFKDGSSFIVPSFVKNSFFYYPSYNFFELYPSYNVYLNNKQLTLGLANATTDECYIEEAVIYNNPVVFLSHFSRNNFLSFVLNYYKLSSVLFYKSNSYLPYFITSESKSDSLIAVLPLFPLVTSEDVLEAYISSSFIELSSFSSDLITFSSLSCYEGSSVKSLLVSNLQDLHLNLSTSNRILLKVFPYFFLNESFGKDLLMRENNAAFYIFSSIALLQRFCLFFDNYFFVKNSLFFLFYCSLVFSFGSKSVFANHLFGSRFEALILTKIFMSFLKETKQPLFFKTGDAIFTAFVSKHIFYL